MNLPDELQRRYEPIALIGKGAFGRVHLVRELATGAFFALKIISKKNPHWKNEYAGIQRYRNTNALRNNIHLIQLLEVGELEDCFYYTMELADNLSSADMRTEYLPDSLAARIENADARLSFDEICWCAYRLLDGVEALHRAGLAHCDIKPSNIVFVNSEPKLADIGLSSARQAHARFGTPGYMVPGKNDERIRTAQANDFYALGMTIFNMLGGKDIAAALPRLSPAESRIRDFCFAVCDPAGTGVQFARDFRRAMSKYAISDPDTPGVRHSRWRYVAVLLAVCLLTLVGAVALFRLTPQTLEFMTTVKSADVPSVQSPPSPQAVKSPEPNEKVAAQTTESARTTQSAKSISGNSDAVHITNRDAVACDSMNLSVLFAKLLDDSKAPEEVRQPIIDAIKSADSAGRWSDQSGAWAFGVFARTVPDTPASKKAAGSWFSMAHMHALNELFFCQAVRQRYQDLGLTDTDALKGAVRKASSSLSTSGQAMGIQQAARITEGKVLSYACARASDLSARLTAGANQELIRNAYRDLLSLRMKEQIARKEYAAALSIWSHLSGLKLVSQEVYLNAAQCAFAAGDQNAGSRLIQEFITQYENTGGWQQFEQAGDLLLQLQQAGTDNLAKRCYEIALKRMNSGRNSIQLP